MKIHTQVLFLFLVIISLIASGCSLTGSDTGLATLIGIVKDSTSVPPQQKVIGATALVEQTGQTAISDASGTFTFTNLAVGAYTILVTKPGYIRYYASFEIIEGDTLKSLNVPLIFGNVFVYDNIILDEYFSDDSYSAADFLTGISVQNNNTNKDVLFRDTLPNGVDTQVYLSSAHLDVNYPGKETWFTAMMKNGTKYEKYNFDTLTKYPTTDGSLSINDFPFREGIDRFLNLGLQKYICAFYLRGRNVSSSYPTYGVMFIDSVWFDQGLNMRRMLVDIKINKYGNNIFNPNSTKK
jgi:hypothetical protein